MPSIVKKQPVSLQDYLTQTHRAFAYAFGFSLAINVLMLAMSLYSLQVLDRVLSSQSLETLAMLSIIAMVCFVVMALLQVVRSTIFMHISQFMDEQLSAKLMRVSISMAGRSSGAQHLRDLATLKSFVTGPAIGQMFDAPWAVVFLGVVFLIHPINGWITLGGGLILLVLAWSNERLTKAPLKTANEAQVVAMQTVDAYTRNAEVVHAMGMAPQVIRQWEPLNDQVITHTSKAAARSTKMSATTKAIRMTIQMATMAMGAWLVIQNQMSAGGIIATSICAGKALAPFDAAVSIWASLVGTKKSFDRLKQAVGEMPSSAKHMPLPTPSGAINIQKCMVRLPGHQAPILNNISLKITAGQCIGIVGPSGSGKTTLLRCMVGVIQPTHGHVRMDGADLAFWESDALGQHVGYLPQDIELFAASIQDNIARMDPSANPEDVINAAKFTTSHDMIIALPNGYSTMIRGQELSAGQRQRVALTRAFYGAPKLVVLDEPNSNLDAEGEDALVATLKQAKRQGITTVMVTHKPSLLTVADQVWGLNKGMLTAIDHANVIKATPIETVKA